MLGDGGVEVYIVSFLVVLILPHSYLIAQPFSFSASWHNETRMLIDLKPPGERII
jgi:hypothetical protein